VSEGAVAAWFCIAAGVLVVLGAVAYADMSAEVQPQHDRCIYECAIQRGAPMLECRPTWAVCGTAREPVIATWRGN
jgi:hypothetical protein